MKCGVSHYAQFTEGFESPARDVLAKHRAKIDPLQDESFLVDHDAYAKVVELTNAKLDNLITLLVAESLTADAKRQTPLVQLLAAELKVNVRKNWRPDATWLANYQKCQLTHLLSEFFGPAYNPTKETRKKSELVAYLAKVFADAETGKLDKLIADRANQWLPANLRQNTGE